MKRTQIKSRTRTSPLTSRTSSRSALLCAVLLVCVNATTASAQSMQNTTYTYLYDVNGNRTQMTDPLGRVTYYYYDALDRVKQQMQPAPAAGGMLTNVTLNYDGLDRLTDVTDPRYLITRYTTDGLGNQTELQSPDTGTTRYTFDAGGNVKTVTDARGKTTTYNYDALNRLTSISYTSGISTFFDYDGGASSMPNSVGRLTRMTDESGQTNYSYDQHGRVLGKVQVVGSGAMARNYAVNYAYGTSGNAVGKLVRISYPSGSQVNIGYDASGRVNMLTLNPAFNGVTDTSRTIPLLTNIAYAPFGQVRSWNWGNSDGTMINTYARAFDLDGRITSYPLGNTLSNGLTRTVAYDPASRITGLTHSGIGSPTPAGFDQGFGYDNLDRLTNFTGNTTSQTFGYDQSGNRTKIGIGATTYSNTIASTSNRMTAASGPLPASTYTYDQAGNIVGDGKATYVYSDRGRLNAVTVGSATVSYLYNGIGQRVRKSGPASLLGRTVVDAVYDEQGRLLGEYDGPENVQQETVYLDDMPVAVLKPVMVGANRDTEVYYVYADHLDTPRVITRSSDNQIVWRWDQADPFGKALPVENPSGLGMFMYNQRFPGQYFDKETNLHYNYYRDYDPSTGRYIQSDPIGLAGGINTYAYVEGNPLIYVDRDGRNPVAGGTVGAQAGSVFGPIGSVVGGVVGAGVGAWIGWNVTGPIFNKDAGSDPKAPGKPEAEDGFEEGKDGGPLVDNPNGPGKGYRDKYGDVWCPTGPRPGVAHGGPHWDVQTPGKGGRRGPHRNVYPGGKVR